MSLMPALASETREDRDLANGIREDETKYPVDQEFLSSKTIFHK